MLMELTKIILRSLTVVYHYPISVYEKSSLFNTKHSKMICMETEMFTKIPDNSIKISQH